MLNISSNSIKERINIEKYHTLQKVENKISSRVLVKVLRICSIIFLVTMFLPWTQNIRSSGNVTTIKPNQKPQTINSAIDGKIEKWYVQEGQFVNKGDTIAHVSEIKNDYLDPELLENTKRQMDLNKSKSTSYQDKIETQKEQLSVLKDQRDQKLEQNKIKLQQTLLKIQNDSIQYLSSKADYEIAVNQYNRLDSLYKMGLKSLTDLEKRNLKMQETNAYLIAAKNKWMNSKNDFINLQIEAANILSDYESYSTKINSEIYTSLSSQLEAETSVSKLQNQYSNYSIRRGMYFILAPQDGYITKTFYSGIGETVKEGSPLVSIMPKEYQLAVQLYVKPLDLPLLASGRKVQIQFDGWPAVVFSGWPNASYGTYEGTVYAIDQFISENGKYRVLVREDSTNYPWPDALRFGGGTSNMIMLENVSIWYELWRNINGFPPEFYNQPTAEKPKK